MQRGGGRGGRGGRGRGGGRGGAAPGPVARDDDGTVLAMQQPEGPPPLYPEMELPEHPEISAKDSLLLLRRHDLVSHSKTSPFFLEPKEKQKGGASGTEAGTVDKYSDRFNKRPARVRAPLGSVMTLVQEYFPEELYSAQDKRASKAAQDAFWKAHGQKSDAGGGLGRLDQLAQLEKMAGEGGKPGEVVGEEEEAPPEDIHDDDEEEEMEFDDYYQGKHFDDDEGYEEYDEGGGADDGPIF